MSKMIDSGVSWIGEVPSSWALIRFKDKYVNVKEIAKENSINYERLALTLNGVIKRPKDDSEGLQPKEFDGKLDLYEEYRQGKITREKFISIQECRQADMDSLQDELAKLERYLAKIKSGREKIDELTADAKDIWALSEYRPEVIRKIVERVRVYENGRIEIDLRNNDDFITEILESAVKMAG